VSATAVVVGGGVFGAATARELGRRGWDVRLVEQYAVGNVRSGSGGDTRIIRFSHGNAEWYSLLAHRALDLWRGLELETGVQVFEPVGVAWFDTGSNDFTQRSERTLARLGIAHERLTPAESTRLYPSLAVDDLRSTLYEPDGGVLHARLATRLLARGLSVETGRVTPREAPRADAVVWACGSWLAKLFPEVVEQRISRRDVFYAGVDGTWTGTPAFCDYGGPYYGHGELGGLGFEFAWDGSEDEIDPDSLERLPDPESERLARAYLGRRFPAIADAPLVGARVCQYDLTGDTHFLFDRHPERSDWWLLGGGSGHGFKHGPALAEYVADCIEGRREREPFHALGPRSGDAGLRTAAVEA
jgi:sarcosine oxidase